MSSPSSTDAPRFPPFRRVITTHSSSDRDGSSTQIYDDTLPLRLVLNDQAALCPIFSTLSLPAPQPHHITPQDITTSTDRIPGVVLPGGVNGQVTELLPGVKVGMHRTSSVDYNVFVRGWAWLITPGEGGVEVRTKVGVGEVVVQGGTMHAWEAGEEGARWVTVVVAAEAVEIEGKELEEVNF